MRLVRAAAIAAIVLAPSLARADVIYRLDAVVNGAPEVFGTISVTRSVVAAGSLSLTRSCQQSFPCFQDGPWDQISFDLTSNLQAGVTSTGPGAVADISLTFGAGGDVTGGSIQVEAPEGGPGVAFLRAALHSGPGPCNGTELCGTYIPVELADPLPVSITFVQQLPSSVPEPSFPALAWLVPIAALLWSRANSVPEPALDPAALSRNCPGVNPGY